MAATMKIFRYHTAEGPRLGLETQGKRFDLTSHSPNLFGSLGGWLAQDDPLAVARAAAGDVSQPVPDDAALLAPVDEQEVWAAGVTYERSKIARQEESKDAGGGDFYDRVYSADRPELFFKSAGWRVVGPDQPIRIRPDSLWNVPEPEMALVIAANGKIVGVTMGNDVSSRSIEGENPLYLPQAKCYDGACAIGPAIVLLGDDGPNLRDLPIRLEIRRNETVVFSGDTSTARMRRTPEDLVSWLYRETAFPRGALLMTGTGTIPPDAFTLQRGDAVSISIDGIGSLVNPVA